MGQQDIEVLINQYGSVLTRFFEHMSDMVFLMAVEEGPRFRYVLMNPAAMQAAGLTEAAYGKLIEEVNPEEKAAVLNSMYRQAVASGTATHFTTYGELVGETILTPICDSNGVCTHVFAVTRDITERKKLESQLAHMAYHDMLTGLPNRRLLLDRMQQAIAKAKRSNQLLAVLFLDCDNFKDINDTWGHDVGDQFLQVMAKRLTSCVRDVDTVARLGGDEFVILLTSLESETEAAKVAARILDVLQQPWLIAKQQFSITTSIGIAFFPHDGTDTDQLLRHADQALYKAKSSGRNNYRFYSPSKK
ncbi:MULTISPECIES: GGDEF domain-containing protein [Bacillales]|jgi:diguanylate cyclase (GGDEF)-like protein/PAS domain S-box-containing protein|uniref:Diguanylate cyclase n=1 Tax=Brevibacillus aydinogluensis TaxID=927786 RepID=A0AA48MBI6_9BACL|nr:MULTISPECIES: GGDEF domain-containing protein [Bacillales]REK66891.1 MAG: GGDEF domain-containing protein [Brevibacillus sp.]MBR8658873.1 GGDEF domain-containing protein [Brevibacillus sp. NL20B1]NNV02379.1 GGDEF domain-containing protein [Brevibacillus sp. MCWH]UFJ62695.1 GGDEF domain-containing protein [Anoxybacillus sediminis]CAJ1004174.1 Diguanylate cyclase [Brevibacillus aydinogluensis]